MEQEDLILKDLRLKIDDNYLGFHPNGTSIKPVHIAGGVFRMIYGKVADTTKIKRLSYVVSAKGVTPPNNELKKVLENLTAEDKINNSIKDSDFESLRIVMQKLLAADKGVFSGERDGMVSYSAGSKYFITNRATYEDAGEMMGLLINKFCPDLAAYIKSVLEEALDPISLLFKPIEITPDDFSIPSSPSKEIKYAESNPTFMWFVAGLKDSAECLIENLQHHPNKLTQLRLFIHFCIFTLIRFMSLLESFFVPENKEKILIRPFVIDFSNRSGSSIANMSELSFTQMHRSISRFYSWAFSEEFEGVDVSAFNAEKCPQYEKGKKKRKKDGSEEIWKYAIDKVSKIQNEQDKKMIIGEAIYDILAIEGTSYPVKYIKALGVKTGVLYPQHDGHPNKRFILSQDVLEMIIKSCVKSDEVIQNRVLRNRLWDRFGIIIGGSSFEINKLEENSSITQIENSLLEENFDNFASLLQDMDLAEIMADGILQIRISNYD